MWLSQPSFSCSPNNVYGNDLMRPDDDVNKIALCYRLSEQHVLLIGRLVCKIFYFTLVFLCPPASTTFGSGPEGPELEGEQADRKFKATNTRRKG